ncbi:major cardiolipin synthase ClsA [Vallitalea longa]|uniref:Cardiolipin synthase n=1 Tax=Vallitalea longa TaxID=2936439 RepID=A0A9W5YFS5_9FIRM|nr:cardiolipin synthase [Vallitalea longa]GKX31119.1 major cardiolipin synthase ClsA [Vallitalea longa]
MENFVITLSYNYVLFFLFNLIFTALIITLERKSPTTTLAWLLFMIMVPGIGFIFYLIFSQNISKRKIFKYTSEESKLYKSILNEQRKEFENHSFKFNDKSMANYTDMILFHNKLSESFYSQNNDIDIITDGKQKFQVLFEELKKAKNHIHIAYYIMKNDTISYELYDILKQKAREGVKVRLLGDHIGCRHIKSKTYKELKEAGIEVALFFPSRFKLINSKANYRNHRKIVVIDGEVGFLGGFNVGDEYLGRNKRFGYWRDTHLKIRGDAVVGLQMRFLLDWRNASKKSLESSLDYFKKSPSPSVGKIGMQIVSSGPDSINEQIKHGFIKMISSAKKSIIIQTPYFIPDESILEALKIASVSGVDVRIMIPNKPDHMFVYWATYSYIGDLLKYGVRAFTYENGFLHSKMIAVDGKLSSVGTCNFDIRSFKLNFEANAFIYDRQTTRKLERQFSKDLLLCNEITKESYTHRSQRIKTRETISRLFSPIL